MVPSVLRMEFFLQRTKITTSVVTMIVTAANTPNTAPTAAPTGDSAPLLEPVLLTALVLVAVLWTVPLLALAVLGSPVERRCCLVNLAIYLMCDLVQW